MRNAAEWHPTKYVTRRGRLRATKDRHELAVGSRLIADLVAAAYEETLPRHASGRLLDLGCGKAPLYIAYKPHVNDVQCVDWANTLHGMNYLDKECDLTGRIPYEDESFDTIILSDVLEHLPEPMNCWQEMNRLLKPGGKVLLNVPFHYQLHEEPHDFYRYTEFALRRFAENSGFKVLELVPVGGAIEVLADLAGKILAAAKLRPVTILLQSSVRAFAKTARGRRIGERTGRRIPLAYFMVAEKQSRAEA